MCETAGLALSGTKEELAKRLLEAGVTSDGQREENIGEINASGYFDVDADSETGSNGATAAGGAMAVTAESRAIVTEVVSQKMDVPRSIETHAPFVQPYSFRDVEEGIDPYGNDLTKDIGAWFDDFEGVANMAHWTDEQRFIMCRRKMVGVARSFLSTERNIISYAALRSKLMKEFGEIVRSSDVHRRLMSRVKRPQETMLEYVYEMQRIARDTEIDVESIIEYIVDGVACDTKVRASLYRARSMAELKEELLRMERAEKKSVVKRNNGQQDQRNGGVGLRKCYICGELGHEAQKCVKSTKCFECGRSGHRAKDCSIKKRLVADTRAIVPSTNERSPVKCFKCGGVGHIARNCNKNSYSVMGGQIQESNKELPTKQVSVCGKEYVALIDTGSEVSLMREDVFAGLPPQFKQWKQSNHILRGLGGVP